MELAKIAAEFTPGAVGVWVGVIMFAGWILREWRETKKLSAEDRLARREGYEKQVQLLTAENRELAEDQRQLREEYDRYRKLCQEETDALRKHVVKLEFDLAGLRRRADTLARDLARLFGGDHPEADRLIRDFEDGITERKPR